METTHRHPRGAQEPQEGLLEILGSLDVSRRCFVFGCVFFIKHRAKTKCG